LTFTMGIHMRTVALVLAAALVAAQATLTHAVTITRKPTAKPTRAPTIPCTLSGLKGKWAFSVGGTVPGTRAPTRPRRPHRPVAPVPLHAVGYFVLDGAGGVTGMSLGKRGNVFNKKGSGIWGNYTATRQARTCAVTISGGFLGVADTDVLAVWGEYVGPDARGGAPMIRAVSTAVGDQLTLNLRRTSLVHCDNSTVSGQSFGYNGFAVSAIKSLQSYVYAGTDTYDASTGKVTSHVVSVPSFPNTPNHIGSYSVTPDCFLFQSYPDNFDYVAALFDGGYNIYVQNAGWTDAGWATAVA